MNNNIEQDSTLVINLNEEYKIKIEKGSEFDTSIFKEVYEAALKNVEEIVHHSSKNNIYDDFNNIIAFTGERGKGKSSSMISFRDALVGKSNENHKTFFKTSTLLTNRQFSTIEIVDPSLFSGGESLFEIILAQMFEEFQIKIKEHACKLNDDSRRNIIKQFQEVFENLQLIKSDRNELYKKESLEALSRLATSSNLRKCFKKLISIYLKEFEDKKDFLVIAIDDFDLNISGAYEMLEDIRHFLIQSNIIILIACKMEQLNEVVETKFEESKLKIELDKKTEKYLEKIIPQHRRIILPDVLVIEKETCLSINNKNYFGANPKEAIVKSIYEITGLFINTPRYRNNTFIPDNLRSIMNLLSFLKKGDPIKELIKYVVDLAHIELDERYYRIFDSLENQKNETLNISLANCISEFKEFVDTLNSNHILFATNPLNVNVGDIYSLLNSINNQLTYTNNKQVRFLDLLHIYYSLRLINIDFNENFYSFYNSTSIKVFRKSSSNKFRDYIYFNKLNIKDLLDDLDEDNHKLWFIHFFVTLGKVNPRFRFEIESPYFKSINGVNQGLFSPLALFSNILFTEKLADQIGLKACDELELSMELKEWNSRDNNLNKLFKNSMFYLELMQYFEEESSKAHKADGLEKNDEGKEIYFNTLFVYFTQSLEKALELISIKYPFLKIVPKEWISNHPIIKGWSEIEKDAKLKSKFINIFQKVFDSQGESKYSENDINIADGLLNTYHSYFELDQSKNSRGAKQAMNSVVKAFKNKEVISELIKYRKEMDSNLIKGLKNIHNLLQEISNG
ncbi:KAP family NTPase [Empedobacter falsenii]